MQFFTISIFSLFVVATEIVNQLSKRAIESVDRNFGREENRKFVDVCVRPLKATSKNAENLCDSLFYCQPQKPWGGWERESEKKLPEELILSVAFS